MSKAAGARKAVLKAFGEVIQEPVAELKSLQIERLNHMLLVLWPKVQGGDVNAIDRFLRVQNEINNLQGVYAPQKTEHKHEVTAGVLVVEGDKDDYIRALQQMAGRNQEQEGEATGQPALPAGDQDDDIIDAIVVEDPREPDPVLDAPAPEGVLVTGPVACERFVVSIDPKDQIKQKCGGCGLPRYKH